VLAGKAFGQFSVASLQRFDDLQMVDDGASCTIILRDRRAADGAYVKQ